MSAMETGPEVGKIDFEPNFEKLKVEGEEMSLAWHDLCLKIGDKDILHGITGHVDAGNMLALMGPSGAGKSSLLNVLAGRVLQSKRKSVQGDIFVNKSKIRPRKFKKQIAYVLQEDNLFATATARESLEFSAKLRLPDGTPLSMRTDIVENLLRSLGLWDVQNTMVGSELVRGLSGGEKKRVSIGVELVTQPSILFLDEPTSGLDSFSALKVVKILSKLCEQTRTAVLCTIHQPSAEVFREFSSTMMLCKGKVVYNGSVDEMPEKLESLGFPFPTYTNPADYMMLIMQTTSAEKLPSINPDAIDASSGAGSFRGLTGGVTTAAAIAADKQAIDSETDDDDDDVSSYPVTVAVSTIKSRKKPGPAVQTALLFKREAQNVVRDKASFLAAIFITTFLNLLFGAIFMGAGDRQSPSYTVGANFGGLFIVLTSALFGAAQAPLLTFPLERGFFLREYATGTYNATPYFISKLLVEIPKYLLQACCAVAGSYFLIGLNANLLIFLAEIWLIMLASSSYALIIGAAVPDANSAQQLAPLVLVPQLLFAGFFISISQIPSWLQPVQYATSLKYGTNLAIISEFHTSDCGPDLGPDCASVLTDNDVDPNYAWLYALILGAIGIGFRALALAILVYRAKNFTN